ncbi:hypothetical protein [Nocardioides mangrovi]|uniref:Uncharacterized protein n=1 Tax=Nocardioides mangrovi TaxID=2874580 RepID=A0ABS7UBA8_9ACTN|nr:hypothetical protein [Nocardioides mangrovi]MBZ5738259.1 hypothetical protein [Nocardioides mangrovi]
MYESMINRATVRSEMDYRLDRIRTDLHDRRARRALTRRPVTGESVLGDR